MPILNCATEKSEEDSEPRRGSTFFIPTLRRALARRMWGLEICCVPERRRCSTTAIWFPLKSNVRALEPLDLASAELQTRLRVMPSVREVERSSTRGSGSTSLHNPQVQSAIALLNLGIEKVERLRRSSFHTFSVVQLGIIAYF